MGRAEEVLKGLYSMREENMLCDIQLEAEGQRISAHKAVLAAASGYFKAMFCGKFRETREDAVHIKEVTHEGLSKVIECIYTTKITLNMNNIEKVLEVAHLLQMGDIVKECTEWMDNRISIATCLRFLEMARKFNIERLVADIDKFILNNFVAVSQMKDFLNIPEAALVKYLASDKLKTNELASYKAARNWISNNEPPATVVEEIMYHIRFALIKPDKLMRDVSDDPIIQRSVKCKEMIAKAVLYHTNTFTQPLLDEGSLSKPRGKLGFVIIPNSRGEGYNASRDHVNVHFIPCPVLKDLNVSTRLDMPVVFESMSCRTINNFLYVFGVNGNGYQNFVKRYDASRDSWLDLAAVPRQAVIGSAIAMCGKDIFLLGGMAVDKNSEFELNSDNIIDDVFVYDISRNTWAKADDLPVALVHAAAAQMQGNIYVTGGEAAMEFNASNKVWAYDLKAKIWLTKAPMKHRRSQHVLKAVDDKLYALGGSAKSVEVYDRLENQWTILLRHDVHLTFGSSSDSDGKFIYLVGGDACKEKIHAYDIEMNRMCYIKGTFTLKCRRSVSALMIMPKLL